MKIFVVGEILADQLGADHLAVLLDQAAIGLMRKDELRNAGHAERVDEAGDDGHHDDHHDGRADLAEHMGDPQARPMAVTARSMSLMPTNGTMMPPTP